MSRKSLDNLGGSLQSTGYLRRCGLATLLWLTLKWTAKYTKTLCHLWEFLQNHESIHEIREKPVLSQKGFVSTKNTAATAYLAPGQNRKLLADAKGLWLCLYLLAEQELIALCLIGLGGDYMSEFAPVAQKYLKHVAKVTGLRKWPLPAGS